MEQIAIWEILRPRILMIVGICITATVVGYGSSFLMTERYTASALVLVRPQQSIKIDTHKADKEFMDFPMSQSTSVETPSKTYIEIIKSAELIGKVVRNLDLDKEKKTEGGRLSKFMPPAIKMVWDGLKQSLEDMVAILKYGRVIDDDPFTKAVKGVQDNLSLKSREDTYLFEIKYSAKDAQLASDVANTTAKTFINYMEEIRQSESQHIRDHLKEQLEQSQRQLESARESLENYKKTQAVFLYETEYNSKLKVISELEVELAKLEDALVGSQSTLSAVSLTAKRARLIKSLNEMKAGLLPLPGIEREFKRREQDVKVALTAYEIVEKEFKEADIKHSSPMPEVRLVSQAAQPNLPSSPLRGMIALIGALGGLVVGIGIAFILEYVNRGVRGIHDVEEFVGVKVLATIPRISLRQWRSVAR
jgi:uncharacterized protein involved in exopolysaccharide biosynthesis